MPTKTPKRRRNWPLILGGWITAVVVVVAIAGPEGTLPGRKSLRQIANEAVGIRVGGV